MRVMLRSVTQKMPFVGKKDGGKAADERTTGRKDVKKDGKKRGEEPPAGDQGRYLFKSGIT
jgi:hypothetical protein